MSASYTALFVIAFSGMSTPAYDREDYSSGTNAAASFGPTTIATTQANEVILAGITLGGSASGAAIDAGFTLAQSLNAVSGTSYGGAIAYQIQSTQTSPSPRWTWTNSSDFAAAFIVLKGTAGAALPPTNSSPPTITGSPFVGNVLTANTGSWANSPTGYAYQWKRGGTDISGATSSTYTVVSGDLGSTLSVTVTASNAQGSVSATSASTSTVVTQSVSSATVQANGCTVAFTLAAAATTLTTGDVMLAVNGYPLIPTAISGSGTSWSVTTGKRWIPTGSTVVVAVAGAGSVTATNSSAITPQMIRHAGRKFGMFIHFGVNTFNNVEWSDGSLPASSFAPTSDIAAGIDSWIAAAKLAGMRYLVLTAKHHDGFALWPSAEGGYNVSNSSWWSGAGSPDIVALFVQKVRAAGLGVGLYFSVWDRKWEASNPGWTNAAYVTHCQNHLTDLLTKYGPIDLLWFDGWNWVDALNLGQPNFDKIPYASLRNHVKGLQPDCLLIVNTHQPDLSYTDVVEFELGGTGGTGAGSSNLFPAESCDTIRADNNWFWHTAADAGLSVSEISTALTAQNGYRAALLLNCPPDRTGAMPAGTLATLAALGSTQLEEGCGASKITGNASTRSITVTLKLTGGAAAASLTGLRCAIYERANPSQHESPIDHWVGSTNASGVLTRSFTTRRAAGELVWMRVTTSDGTATQSGGWQGFEGPVVVA